MSKVLEALVAVQSELKAPKDQSAGRYRYRNIEDINEAVKPLASANGCAVVYTDRFAEDGTCVSTCTLMGPDGEISAEGVSYVNRSPKNMSVEQACGAASSYARKYAACGLFAIDSSEVDPDRTAAPQRRDPPDALKAAYAHMGRAIEVWCAANGKDSPEDVARAKEGVTKRPEWPAQNKSVDYIEAVAREFEDAANG